MAPKKGSIPWNKGIPNSGFKKGYVPWNKGKENPYTKISRFGEENPNWKGGERIDYYGYILVRSPNHPLKPNNGYMKKHRLVVEKELGRYLLRSEKVHHLGEKTDNRPHKLMAFVSHSAHMRFELGGIVKIEEIIFDGRKLQYKKENGNDPNKSRTGSTKTASRIKHNNKSRINKGSRARKQ